MKVRWVPSATLSLLLAASAGAAGQESGRPWTDPSPHEVGFLAREGDVQLEYLDWGGAGEALLFLAGGGSSAHSFDRFAPGLTDRFRAVGLTRRGHGASSDAPFDLAVLVEDVRALLDHLGIERAHLVGVSWAGEELTRFAVTHPERVSSLVYVDAALDRTNPADERILRQAPAPPRRPEDLSTVEALTAWLERTLGYAPPEAELRARFLVAGDGGIRGRRLTPETQSMLDAAEERPSYAGIRAPALAIYALHDTLAEAFPWVLSDREAMVRALRFPVRSYLEARRQEIEQFRTEVDRGRVVVLEGPHDLVAARPDQVAQVMRELHATAASSRSPPEETRRTRPGETVRVVRFHVKPERRADFERFFTEDLTRAAAKLEGIPVKEVNLGTFRLLVPSEANPQGHFVYYVLVDPLRDPLGSGETMRDMVREAFPGEDGEERVRRWMAAMVLDPLFAPYGETFTEADLRAGNPPQ